ncbi:MAG TPA: hypothetical protein VF145_07730, partial [Chitinophagaceae bacterium]
MKPWLSRSGWSEPVIYLAAALLFILVVATNFTKPFGFFRESNPALVAINATYWQQNPDVRKQHIPVASYAFDKTAPPATQFDNTITTFGYAWFEVPYWFIEITRMQPGPVALRLFSVLWLALTMLFVFKLAVLLAAVFGHKRRTVIITILLYLFSP